MNIMFSYMQTMSQKKGSLREGELSRIGETRKNESV